MESRAGNSGSVPVVLVRSHSGCGLRSGLTSGEAHQGIALGASGEGSTLITMLIQEANRTWRTGYYVS